jgi:hypothetical protein
VTLDYTAAKMKASHQGRQAFAALAVVLAALAVCTVLLSFRNSAPRKTVLASKDGSTFQGQWSNWLNKVTTQVDAALHVSKGIPEQKKAQLDGILRHDLVSAQKTKTQTTVLCRCSTFFSHGYKSSHLLACAFFGQVSDMKQLPGTGSKQAKQATASAAAKQAQLHKQVWEHATTSNAV